MSTVSNNSLAVIFPSVRVCVTLQLAHVYHSHHHLAFDVASLGSRCNQLELVGPNLRNSFDECIIAVYVKTITLDFPPMSSMMLKVSPLGEKE